MKATADWLKMAGRQYLAHGSSSAFVHLGKYTAELYECGNGSPVVLVPGLAGGCQLVGPLAEKLATNHRVLTYQLRGESDCFFLRHPFDLDDLVDDLAELVDSLCLERPTIMGVSFGGIIALKFAIRYPHRLDRLVVQGVGARYERGLLQQIASTVLSRFPLPADSPFVNQFFNLLFGGRVPHDALFDFVIRQVWQTDQSMMAHRFRLIEEMNFEDDLRRIQAPTMILSSDRDILISQRSLSPLCHMIPNVHHVRLAGCGHLAFVTKPGEMAKRVEEFLQA